MTKLSLPVLALMSGLAACSDSGTLNPADTVGEPLAVIAVRAADFSSGAHSVFNLRSEVLLENLAPDGSDLSIRGDGDGFFRVGRLFGGSTANTLSRYPAAQPDVAQYTYSTQDAATPDEGSNPYDVLRIGADKAYVLRYGSGDLWIVDPQATTEAAFFRGRIDLSAFDSDGVPEMVSAVQAAGRVYVLLQRLQNFDAAQPSLLAVIDPATDTLIDMQPEQEGVQALELPLHNGTQLLVRQDGSALLALGIGGADFDAEFNVSPRFDGGIAQIALADHAVTLLLDDGEPGAAPYGQFALLTETLDGALWLVAGDAGAAGADRLFRVQGASNTASAEGLPAATQNVEITSLAAAPDGELWLGLTGNPPGILRLNLSSNSVRRIDLSLVPLQIEFVGPVSAP